jgi:DNA-binding transcriptional ArsR family regulator
MYVYFPECLDRASLVINNEYAGCDRELTGADTMNADTDYLMTRDEDIERASRSLKAMSHPLRLKILCTLGSQEVSVQDIVEHVGTSQSNISQHLAILRDKGILASRKDANRVYYRVGDTRTLRLISMMREVFCSQG